MVGGEFLGRDLDGHLALQIGVVGAIHLAHTARAERLQDLVMAESDTCLLNGHGYWQLARTPKARLRMDTCMDTKACELGSERPLKTM